MFTLSVAEAVTKSVGSQSLDVREPATDCDGLERKVDVGASPDITPIEEGDWEPDVEMMVRVPEPVLPPYLLLMRFDSEV